MRCLWHPDPFPTASLTAPAPVQQTAAAAPDGTEPAGPSRAPGIDKSALAIAAPRRYRNRHRLVHRALDA
jgi:hypothetical protein